MTLVRERDTKEMQLNRKHGPPFPSEETGAVHCPFLDERHACFHSQPGCRVVCDLRGLLSDRTSPVLAAAVWLQSIPLHVSWPCWLLADIICQCRLQGSRCPHLPSCWSSNCGLRREKQRNPVYRARKKKISLAHPRNYKYFCAVSNQPDVMRAC